MEESFNFPSKTIDPSSTKRGVLSAVASIFDPIGFLTPFILKAKLLLQSMWRLKIGWDDKLPLQAQKTLQADCWDK